MCGGGGLLQRMQQDQVLRGNKSTAHPQECRWGTKRAFNFKASEHGQLYVTKAFWRSAPDKK